MKFAHEPFSIMRADRQKAVPGAPARRGLMAFEIGTWVKWSEVCPARFGHAATAVGQVVGVQEFPAQGLEIDVEFANGEVVRGAIAKWFEPAAMAGAEPELANAMRVIPAKAGIQ
jgi:hypothetical protein